MKTRKTSKKARFMAVLLATCMLFMSIPIAAGAAGAISVEIGADEVAVNKPREGSVAAIIFKVGDVLDKLSISSGDNISTVAIQIVEADDVLQSNLDAVGPKEVFTDREWSVCSGSSLGFMAFTKHDGGRSAAEVQELLEKMEISLSWRTYVKIYVSTQVKSSTSDIETLSASGSTSTDAWDTVEISWTSPVLSIGEATKDSADSTISLFSDVQLKTEGGAIDGIHIEAEPFRTVAIELEDAGDSDEIISTSPSYGTLLSSSTDTKKIWSFPLNSNPDERLGSAKLLAFLKSVKVKSTEASKVKVYVSTKAETDIPAAATGTGSSVRAAWDEMILSQGGLLEKDDHFAFLFGYPEGTFMPDANMTRAEVTTMFYRLLKTVPKPSSVTFTDVKSGDWFATAVNGMAGLGIVVGDPEGTFRPDDPITRAEFAAIASRFDKLSASSITFPDVPLSHWAANYIASAAQKGWVSGYPDGTFRPDNFITRAEVSRVTVRLLERSADQDFISASPVGLKTFSDITSAHWAYYDIMEAANGHNYERKDGELAEKWLSLKS